jgi:hypothetical protein
MEFAKATDSINTLLKSATPEGGTTTQYDKIPGMDAQRDLIVSHIKCAYASDTGEMINTKEFVDTSKTYKNMLTTIEGELDASRNKLRKLEKNVKNASVEADKTERTNRILLTLLITVTIAVALYIMLGSWGHGLVFLILVGGFMFALYTRGEKLSIDFSPFKQWISTMPVQWPTFKSSLFQDT